ncbi:MAG: GNAT family N-acetyltransferase [Bacteroidota bacterium]
MTDNLRRTDSANPDFLSLVKMLDKDLLQRYKSDQSFFDQFNKLDSIKHVIVAYRDGIPAGCGSIKKYDKDSMEVKRMFVEERYRGKGIAGQVLNALEKWAKELNYSSCILETGDKSPEAIALYKKSGYQVIPNYGQYANVESSICMKKMI